MNASIKEQLAEIFGIRNEMVHNPSSIQFSAYFRTCTEQYDIDLEELARLLERRMRPGKALRRLLEMQIKCNAQRWADREGFTGDRREKYVQGFLEANLGASMDETVKELAEAYTATGDEIYFAETPEYIADVYRLGPTSCMVDDFASQMAGLAYGSCPALAVAYCRDSRDRISARTLVNLHSRTFGRVYGDESNKLSNGLLALGYSWHDEDRGSPADGELLFVPLIRETEKEDWTTNAYASCVKMYVKQTYRPPDVDWTDGLIATEETGWVHAFGKKWLGRWMRPVKFWSVNMVHVDSMSGIRMSTELRDIEDHVIALGVDELPEMWEFHSHASEATPMQENQVLREEWSSDPILKWSDWY